MGVEVDPAFFQAAEHRPKSTVQVDPAFFQAAEHRPKSTVQVDPAFFQAAEHRPKSTVIAAGGIPLIDLSPLLTSPIPPSAISSLIAEIEAACRDWGFFQVINHGVPHDLLSRVQSCAKHFFSLPSTEKRRVNRDELNPMGYYDTEHTKNVRDWKEVFDFVVHELAPFPDRLTLKNQWPSHPPEMKQSCNDYAAAVKKLSFQLLELISLSLGLPAKRLNAHFNDQTSFIRLNHYPPCPVPDLALGVGRHKDSGALTVLFQDEVGGLEVKRRTDGEWVRVKPIENSYIINVGDVMQVWSNDRYESAEHRVVVNSEKERFSIPFFFNPASYTEVAPLEEVVLGECRAARYRGFNWGEFLASRKHSNFKKLDAENVQVSDYRKEK